MSHLTNIIKEITAQPTDARAEVIIARLLSAGVSWPQLAIHTDDFFTRRFSRDITRTEIQEAPGFTETLHVHLSRTGLFDLLPEGLFFAPVSADKSPKNAGEMAEEYKANQIREAGIRQFFAPFENEFFYHRVKNFTTEVQLLNGLKDELLNRFFIQFWNLPNSIQPQVAIKLILLLPYVHQVAGDAELMAASLQTILAQNVTGKLVTETMQDAGLDYHVLGNYELGNEFTCGKKYFEEEYNFEFTIHLKQGASATDYLPGGTLYPVLETFRRFFVPAQTGMTTQIKLPAEQEQMQPGDFAGAMLGIGTVI